MEERFRRETQGLARSWTRHDRRTLRDYLVQGVQDPRINVQSILTRHFLLGRLFPGRFGRLMEHELRFALAMNWLLGLGRRAQDAGAVVALMDAAMGALLGEDGAEPAVPSYVAETFAALPATAEGMEVPEYLLGAIAARAAEPAEAHIHESVLATFERLWRGLLARQAPRPISVVEPACGSAGDYRFLDRFGIARFLDYRGFDLCPKNIDNASLMFPDVRFEVGNVLEIAAPDDAFECAFVHDLFEHLSVEAMARAVAEVCRVTRRGLCVGFFHMHAGGRHVVQPVDRYHWNRLSMPATRATFLQHARAVQVVHIDSFLRRRFACGDTHNKGAYTFVVTI